MSSPGHFTLEMGAATIGAVPPMPTDATAIVIPAATAPKAQADGMRIALKGVSFSVRSRADRRQRVQLLSGVSGCFEPSQMTALMGPSGSGKTTLLDIMAGRKTSGHTDGDVLFDGAKPTQAFLRRRTGYCEQNDTLIPSLTVEQMLMYTAELKRPASEPLAAKRAAVEELMERLALTSCRDVKIGSQLSKGISGGQAKRVNIGIALITNPCVLFLDEPTSGLDSHTANEVMTVVKGLVSSGVTIVATIHSPSAYAFSLFDRVMMLSRGSLVYCGLPGQPMQDYIEAHMLPVLPAPAQGQAKAAAAAVPGKREGEPNQAEYLVDLVTEADRHGLTPQLAAAYAASWLRAEVEAAVAAAAPTSTAVPSAPSPEGGAATQALVRPGRATATTWWRAVYVLLKYRTVTNYRDPQYLMPHFADKLIISLLLLTLYWQIGDSTTPTNIANQYGVLFMWVGLSAFGAGTYLPSIVLERALFVRERADGLYRVISYMLAKVIDELALAAVASLVVSAGTFYGIGLMGDFVLFWLVYLVTLAFGINMAYFVAAVAPNMEAANGLLAVYTTALLFFGGLMINFRDMPVWWKWFSYIDPMKYAWGALMVNQFGANDPMWQGGQTLLSFYGFAGVSKWAYLGYLSLFSVVFFLLAYITLSVRRYSSR